MSLMVSVFDIQHAYVGMVLLLPICSCSVYFLLFKAAFLKDRKPWIVKPVASSRGRGIYLVNHVSTDTRAVKCLSSSLGENQITLQGLVSSVMQGRNYQVC